MLYNPLNKLYKTPIGSVKEGSKLCLKVKTSSNYCDILIKKDGEEFSRFSMIKSGEFFSIELSLKVGLYFYTFNVHDNLYIVPNENLVGIISNEIGCFQLSVYSKNYSIPNWNRGGIIYQIFPDRFNRVGNIDKSLFPVYHENLSDTPVYNPNEQGEVLNNDFFGGNFKGIIEKLPYLKALGVTCIYLNPIFKAYSNHRYDTLNYFEIDEKLGTQKDFDELIEKCNNYGIKIILDGVFNHCGSDSVYFDIHGKYGDSGAYNNPKSKYRKWFNFINYPKKYDCWWGIKTLPSFNKNCKEYVDFITGENGVIDYWTKKGIGGWRLDVVDELPKEIVEKLRKRVKSIDKDAYIIGEVWEDASNKIAYGVRRKYFLGKELDSVMNYPLKDAIISCVKKEDFSNLIKVVKVQQDHYSTDVLNNLMNVLSTHDTVRLLTAIAGSDYKNKTKEELEKVYIPKEKIGNAIKKLKIATFLQYFLYGIPSIYYGDEIGMEGYKDPLNRRFFNWGNKNQEILNWFKKIGQIRKDNFVFKNGVLKEIYCDKNCLVYSREDDNSDVLLAVNLSDKIYKLNFNGKIKDLLTNNSYINEINIDKFDVIIGISE